MWRWRWLVQRPVLVVAVKAGLASGLAFYLGSLLPEPLDGYKYYAALGAFTVVGLVLVDSVKESLQVFGAVAVGVTIALLIQSLTFANPVTVAVTIAAGVLLGATRIFGVQRTWAPLAALFVLATGGPDPEPMALGYVVQVPLGALVGVLVNALIFAPLGDDDLEAATASVQGLLAAQMRSYADILREQAGEGGGGEQDQGTARREDDPAEEVDDTTRDEVEAADRRGEVVHDNIVELERAQSRLRSAIIEARRAMRGNPRVHLQPGQHTTVLTRADATSRCAATLMAVGVVLGQSAPALTDEGVVLRRRSAAALGQAADVFDDPAAAHEAPGVVERSEESVQAVLDQARTMDSHDGLDHVLFGALALAIEECLKTFATEVAQIVREGTDAHPPDGA